MEGNLQILFLLTVLILILLQKHLHIRRLAEEEAAAKIAPYEQRVRSVRMNTLRRFQKKITLDFCKLLFERIQKVATGTPSKGGAGMQTRIIILQPRLLR